MLNDDAVPFINAKNRADGVIAPSPGVAEPQLWHDMQRRVFGATIVCRNQHENIIDTSLGIFHEHIEIPIVIEHSAVHQLEFRRIFAALSVLLY